MAMTVSAPLLRAVLVSHFPGRFTEDTLIPKMRSVGVDIVRTVNMDRSATFRASDADLVVCMCDFMSHSAYRSAREIAAKANRPFLALTRKAADWEDKLARFVPKVQAATAPASIAPPPASGPDRERPSRPLAEAVAEVMAEEPVPSMTDEPNVEEMRELLALFEAESASLQDEVRQLQKRLADSDALVGSLERQLEYAQREQPVVVTAATPAVTKADLFAWERLLREVRAGKPAAFAELLELAARLDINPGELLPLVRGS